MAGTQNVRAGKVSGARKSQIAVLDANPAILDYVHRILAKHFDVSLYTEAHEFCRSLKESSKPDLLLVDVYKRQVYGNTPTLPKQEQMQPSPISPYAVTKLAGELYMQSFTRVYGLETVTLRYFNVFGPCQDPTSHYSGVLAIFALKMLAAETPTIYGDGEQSRDFTFIQNVVHGNLLASEAPAERVSGKVFNVATGTRITLNQAVEILRKATGYSGEVRYAPERGGDVKHSLADIGLAKQCFGYEPLVQFSEGVERTVDWYRTVAKPVIAGAGGER